MASSFEKKMFTFALNTAARLATNARTRALVPPLMRALAAATRLQKRSAAPRATRSDADVASAWQAYLPSRRQHPVVGSDAAGVRAEIRVSCPLRGSGDLDACHALMEYDRALLRPHGGGLTVLRSHASAGVHVCEVLLSRTGDP